MEPLSLTVATLLAVNAAESLGTEAGKKAWSALQRLAEVVRRKFRDADTETPLDQLEAAPADDTALQTVAQTIDQHAWQDAAFRQELEDLVAEARQDPSVGRFLTQISGNAQVGKVTNIGQVQGNVTL